MANAHNVVAKRDVERSVWNASCVCGTQEASSVCAMCESRRERSVGLGCFGSKRAGEGHQKLRLQGRRLQRMKSSRRSRAVDSELSKS